ncbi:Ribosomal-protein-alanine acetyltransferase [Mycena indigotica]|uniref:Ribosomal-protein-alanine acetyltransferase n=1 Tax=Mycena indigotica TaxID=2126181 RepID=A0A8H6W7L9_9AGAR|nr:Ribosomal-protein-alanine acetyltransferase [Mycena indigotica]KAF7302229.1 Ribosomal-protein-alanine acetyltransferase [Mycena indigotica]
MFLAETINSKSGRVSLVPPNEADDPYVSVLRSHPDTRRYLRFLPDTVDLAAATQRRLSRQADPSLVDFHIHTTNGEFVGTTGIFRIDTDYGNSCEVGILIMPERARGGLATDALYTVLEYVFETRQMNRAEFQTGVDNVPMRGWLERAGAALERTRRAVWTDPATGKYSDVCIYGILKDEWTDVVKERLRLKIFKHV